MKICELSENDIEKIIDQFEDAKYLKLKAKKIINDIMIKYNLTYNQLYCIIIKKNRPHLMRRHDEKNMVCNKNNI